jgi:hypothetical protein
MKNNISREKVQLFCLIIAIIVLMGAIGGLLTKNEKLEEQLAIDTEPKVITGEYTIIHYPNGGWINSIHITDYYLVGRDLYYKEKNSTEYKILWFPNIIFADGWLEGKELADYGYWITDLDFDNGG